MTGCISGIKHNAIHDGDGVRTTVFFKGCPLKCVWCHNPESLSFHPQVGFYAAKCIGCQSCVSVCPVGAMSMQDGKPIRNPELCRSCGECAEICPQGAWVLYGKTVEAQSLVKLLLRDRVFYESGGGVTLSGGECLSQPEFAAELARLLRAEGVSVYIDTCGFTSRAVLEKIIPYTDKFLYDIKAIDDSVHRRCTGQGNREILDNLRFLLDSGRAVEIRYPYVPGWNDGECAKIGEFLAGLSFTGKIKVLGYHSFADGKYAALGLANTLPNVKVSASDVQCAVDILRGYGLNAVNGMLED